MSTSENQLRKGAIALLKKYGKLTTNEVKKRMSEFIEFDDDDKKVSKTRKAEWLINQRIGNIVSHQKDKTKIYFDSYQIDKSGSKAYWIDLTGLKSNGSLSPITDETIDAKAKKSKKFSPVKINWKELNEERTNLGKKGEKFVLDYEKERVGKFAPDDLERIIHMSELEGDGTGYDVLSVNEDGTDRFIEVKTTKGDRDTPFYLSSNELEFFKINRDEKDCYLYRVYNFHDGKGDIEIIKGSSLIDKYNFSPSNYRVTKEG